jgi:hypothetical protein
VTDLDNVPAAALAGCTVMHSITIFYPVHDVPDYGSRGRRHIRPRQVNIYASRLNGAPWQLSSPLVIGREVLKSGALGLVDRSRSTVTGDWPDWLGAIVRSIRKALEEGHEQPARHAPLTDDSCGATPTPAGTAAANAYRAHRTEQHPHLPAAGNRPR